MGILESLSSAFEHPENWVEFECDSCGETFRIDRGEKRVCPSCGSTDVTYVDSA